MNHQSLSNIFTYILKPNSYLFDYLFLHYVLGFDELSDTSTLVGDGDMDRAEEDLTPQPVILEENVENEGDTVES